MFGMISTFEGEKHVGERKSKQNVQILEKNINEG